MFLQSWSASVHPRQLQLDQACAKGISISGDPRAQNWLFCHVHPMCIRLSMSDTGTTMVHQPTLKNQCQAENGLLYPPTRRSSKPSCKMEYCMYTWISTTDGLYNFIWVSNYSMKHYMNRQLPPADLAPVHFCPWVRHKKNVFLVLFATYLSIACSK